MNFLKPIFIIAIVIVISGIGFFWKMGEVNQKQAESADVNASIASDSLFNKAIQSFDSSESVSEKRKGTAAKILAEPSVTDVTADSSEKLQVLESILSKANDNDPRMDTVLRNFSAEEKQMIISKYSQMEPELLNQRGTLVFLVGRELKDVADVQFLSDVLQSEPCRSLGRCSEEVKGARNHEGEIGTEMTLIYPQMVALHSIETNLRKPDTSAQAKQDLQNALQVASRSPHPLIANRASEILQNLSRE